MATMTSIPNATGTAQLEISLMTTYNLRYDEVRKSIANVRSETAMAKWNEVTPELWKACHERISKAQTEEIPIIPEDKSIPERSLATRVPCPLDSMINETLDAAEGLCRAEDDEEFSSSSHTSSSDRLQEESGEKSEVTDATTATDDEELASCCSGHEREGCLPEVAGERVSSETVTSTNKKADDQNELLAETLSQQRSEDSGLQAKNSKQLEPPKVIYLLHAYMDPHPDEKEDKEKLGRKLTKENRRVHHKTSRSPIQKFPGRPSTSERSVTSVGNVRQEFVKTREQKLSGQESKSDKTPPMPRKRSAGKPRPKNVMSRSALVKTRSTGKNSRMLFVRSQSEKTEAK